MDGLIHISELSWSHVNHPSEVLEIGQKVKVKVLDIDRDRQRISLGLKQTQSDPWQQVLESYNEGDVVSGKVTKVVTFGAFVEILPGVEGLVHISELAQHHVENPREVVSQGDTVNVRILEVDAERRRLSLSLKRVDDGHAAAAARRATKRDPPVDRPVGGRVLRRARRPPPTAESSEDAVESGALDEASVNGAQAVAAERARRGRRSRSARSGRNSVTRPLAVALTGGIAAGKSEALAAFARHGAATASRDAIVHELFAADGDVRDGDSRRASATAPRTIAHGSPTSCSRIPPSSSGSRRCCIRASCAHSRRGSSR